MNKSLGVGTAILFILSTAALMIPLLGPFPQEEISLSLRLLPPGSGQWMGTDHLGRSIVLRVIQGSGTSLVLGLGAVLAAMIPGTALGVLAVLAPRGFRHAVQYAADVMLAFPVVMPALVLAGSLEPGPVSTLCGLAVSGWAWWTRFVRGQVRIALEQEYVMAARMMPIPCLRWIRCYILPQIFPRLLAFGAFQCGAMIAALAGLGYLGLGIQPPAPELGALLNEAGLYMEQAPWMAWGPGICIVVIVLGFQLTGEGMRKTFCIYKETL